MMKSTIQGWKLLFCLALVSIDASWAMSDQIKLTTKLVHIGEDAKLTCLIDDDYVHRSKLDIMWEKPLGTVIGQGPELYLKNVQQVDVGSYICKAIGVVNGRMVSKFVTEELTVDETRVVTQSPPDIIVPQSSNGKIVIYETQNLNMQCKVGNWSRAEYDVQWLTQEGYVASNSEHLMIESVLQKKHQGEYVCAVQHKQNEQDVFRKRVQVVIEVPQMRVEILSSERLTVGGLIHRRCVGFKLDQSTETFTYIWMDPLGRRVSATDIIQIPITSMSAQGKYKCQYQAHRSGKRFEIETEVDLAANISSNEPLYAISILEMPPRFRMGEKLTLRCSVAPNVRDIKYTWYKDNQYLQVGGTLDIETFTKNDLGAYKCHAIGQTERGNKIDLIAQSFQSLHAFNIYKEEMIEGRGTQVEVNMFHTKELNCYISLDNGFSGKDVIWNFNGNELKTNEDLKRFGLIREDRSISSILHISSTNINNEGHYTCSVGGVTKATTIIVREESGVLTIYPKIQEEFEGHSSEFHCKINNIPNIEKTDIRWHFISKDGSRRISLPNTRWRTELSKVVQHTSYIVTASLQMIDNGYIVCSLDSGVEERAEIIVKTKLKPFVVKVSKPTVTVKKLQRFEFECFSEDKNGVPTGVPVLKFLNGTLVSTDSQFEITSVGPSRIRLVAPFGLNLGSNKLQISCGVDEKVAIVTIKVQDVCPPHWRYCSSGDCIPLRKFCDGVNDCPDGSDEDPQYCSACDPIRKPCAAVSGYNATVPFYDVHNACNGVNDCENGFDEKNCPTPKKCNTMQFTCKDGVQIPYSYVCDKESDCKEGEDEIGCRLPEIVQMSNKKIFARVGREVKLMCEARGFPLPKIVWKYNWRCLPDESRMITSEESQNCVNVISTLTIKNFQAGDDALYTCEALAGTDRHQSQPIEVRYSK